MVLAFGFQASQSHDEMLANIVGPLVRVAMRLLPLSDVKLSLSNVRLTLDTLRFIQCDITLSIQLLCMLFTQDVLRLTGQIFDLAFSSTSRVRTIGRSYILVIVASRFRVSSRLAGEAIMLESYAFVPVFAAFFLAAMAHVSLTNPSLLAHHLIRDSFSSISLYSLSCTL